MTAALTPELAIAYVRELSADVRAVVVLDGAGVRLAGSRALEGPARAFMAAAGEAPDIAARVPDGLVLVARTAQHAIVVAAGPLSLVGPTAIDVRRAVEALSDRQPAQTAATRPRAAAPHPDDASEALRAAAQAVISATQRAF